MSLIFHPRNFSKQVFSFVLKKIKPGSGQGSVFVFECLEMARKIQMKKLRGLHDCALPGFDTGGFFFKICFKIKSVSKFNFSVRNDLEMFTF